MLSNQSHRLRIFSSHEQRRQQEHEPMVSRNEVADLDICCGTISSDLVVTFIPQCTLVYV